MQQQLTITIQGTSPLLMHRWPLVPIEAIEKKTVEEQAEYAAYRIAKKGGLGDLYLPAVALQRAIVKGAAYSKGKGRATLQKQTAACVLITPEYLSLNTKEYEIDSRPVVIPATKGRITRHRPRLDQWQVSFNIEFDDSLLKSTELRRIIDDTGSRVGVLDFRPEKNGPFGRFIVIKQEA